MDNNSPRKSMSKILKIVFVVIFAISTIGYFAFIPFLDSKLTKAEENIMFLLMFLDAGLWVVSFFGFLFTCLWDSIKKTKPELICFDPEKSFLKNVWDNTFIMFIISTVLLLVLTIVFSVLEIQWIWIIMLAFSIVISIILAFCIGWRRFAKILFIAILVCALITSVSVLIYNISNSGNDNIGCGVCNGTGLVPNKGAGFSTCPNCRGSGILPI